MKSGNQSYTKVAWHARLLGNYRLQRWLSHWVQRLNRWRGIGTGSWVDSSGESQFIAQLLAQPKHYCVFDVGANQGDYTRLLAQWVHDAQSNHADEPTQLAVHAFEASEYTYGQLEANVAGLASENIRLALHNSAVGAEPGTLTLYADQPGSGLASLTQRHIPGVAFTHSEAVNVICLADYCAEQGIEHIDLLKIDVEGHELAVLQGAEPLFEAKKIAAVAFEFGGCNVDTRTYLRDFVHWFTGHGLTVYRLLPGGYLHPVNYTEHDELFVTTNFVALRDALG